MIDIPQLTTRLEPADEGLWRAKNTSKISYSDSGNQRCLEIEEHSFWFNYRNLMILEAIKRFPPEGAIFDIGGGNGYVSLGIQNAGFDCVVVEPGQGAINAHRRGLRPVINSTLQDADFKSGSLPAAGIFDVLEHIENDRGFLETLKCLLVENGRLYVTVPAYQFLWSPEDVRAGHFRRYRLQQLRATLEAAGFSVDFESYMFGLLILPIFLSRVIPGRLGLREKRDTERTQKEHKPNNSLASRVMTRGLKKEVRQLAAGKSLPYGSSCLVVARA